MVVRKKGAWIVAKIGDVYALMSQEKVSHIGISGVGARIWELIETKPEVDAICAQLCKEYATDPEACRVEVDIFLQDLVKQGAVIVDARAA
jgi:hypothetical protein